MMVIGWNCLLKQMRNFFSLDNTNLKFVNTYENKKHGMLIKDSESYTVQCLSF